MDDTKRIDGPGREVEGGGQSSGLPAHGAVDVGANEPLERSGQVHWMESTITRPGLDDRGDVFFASVEMTRMPMVITDPNQPDNPVVFVNRAFLDLTGYEEDEVLGRNCRFLQGAQTDRAAVDELRQGIDEHRAVSVEILNYKRDGTPFWNAVFVGPVYDREGRLLYFFSSQLDVTRRRNSEQAYRQAQKMEAIGQLTAGLAHDFNNLLQVVEGNLELIERRSGGDAIGRYVANARAAAERGAKLTRQLLAFARKTRLEPKAVNLSALVGEVTELLETTLGQQVELHLSLRRSLPYVMVDPEQFEMALLNIVINARDAMPEGGLITISTRALHLNGDAVSRELPPGDYVAVEVRDEGEGMPPHVVERAAEPFFTTKGLGKGTGLGLAMTSGFAQQSRGRLEIDSEVGKGTTIRLLFPVTHARPGEPAPVSEPRPVADVDRSCGERILVVEDSPEVRELAVEILSDVGYRVVAAPSGEAAVELLEKGAAREIDLLFTDVIMPGGMNGLVLAEKVASLAPEIPILLTTGYNEDMVAQGPERPALDVIGKPYRRSELIDRVRQALNRRPHERRKPSQIAPAQA